MNDDPNVIGAYAAAAGRHARAYIGGIGSHPTRIASHLRRLAELAAPPTASIAGVQRRADLIAILDLADNYHRRTLPPGLLPPEYAAALWRIAADALDVMALTASPAPASHTNAPGTASIAGSDASPAPPTRRIAVDVLDPWPDRPKTKTDGFLDGVLDG